MIAPETNIVVKVDCPPNRRGPKGSAATPEEVSDPKGHGGDELEVMNANEPWNEYRIIGTGIRLRERLILDRVFRIKDRFGNLGDPVYVVRFTVVPTIE